VKGSEYLGHRDKDDRIILKWILNWVWTDSFVSGYGSVGGDSSRKQGNGSCNSIRGNELVGEVRNCKVFKHCAVELARPSLRSLPV
jgi:hypothetical protein